MLEQPTEMKLDVLGYREDRKWVALCLDMDLRGYGGTFDEAAKELAELVAMQISFARFKGRPELVLKPAEAVYWRLFHETLQRQLWGLASATQAAEEDADYTATGLSIPSAHVIAELSPFSPANA